MVLDLSQKSMLGAGVSADRYHYIVGTESSLFGLESYRLDGAVGETWNSTSDEQMKHEAGLDFRFEKLPATASAKGI
jgi:hypothetical protein